MNPDLEKLIKMAGEGAGLTEKKRETGSVDKANPTWEKPVSSRCRCPNCGFALDSESTTSTRVQQQIDAFNKRLKVQPGLNDNMIRFVEDNNHILTNNVRTSVITLPKVLLYLAIIFFSCLFGSLLIKEYLW